MRASHSYGFVLLLAVLTFTFTAVAPDERWSQSVLVLTEATTLASALWVTGLQRDRRILIVFAVAGLTVAVVQMVGGGTTVTGIAGVLGALFLVMSCVAVGVGVFDQREVNRQSVVGAVSIYVMLGMIFTAMYGAAAVVGSGSFFAQGTDGTPSIRLYFSYVTLATLGYGDYTPTNDFGRTLAIVEALLGQLYLVTVVAILVGNLGQRRPER